MKKIIVAAAHFTVYHAGNGAATAAPKINATLSVLRNNFPGSRPFNTAAMQK